jgi:hypothetical protein
MILIYCDSQAIQLEWLPHILFPDAYQTTSDIHEYLQTSAEQKIAFVGYKIYSTVVHQYTFEEQINLLSANSKYVFTWDSEIHPVFWPIWESCDQDNVYWLMPGTVNHEFSKQVIPWADWFKNCVDLYRRLPDKLNAIRPYTEKPKYFDAFLGMRKPHRDFVFDSVNTSGLRDIFVMPYGGVFDDKQFYAQDYFLYEPDTVAKESAPGTAGAVDYCGIHTSLSKIIHIDTYNATAYSVIAETNYDNSFSFFTEKTAKPLIGRRLFVAFSGHKFLHNLRQLGFRTFDGIIDESYDLIEDDQARWTAAFDQIKYLCQQPQQLILDRIRPITEHNFNTIMNTNWVKYSSDHISDIVNR